MKNKGRESGQALILIVFGMIVLIGLTGLAVDGGMAYSDRRNAQNAADAAALAAALANARQRDVNSAAFASTFTNGYNNDGVKNVVTVTIADSPAGTCEGEASGKDITVQIVSHINTMFAPVIGIRQMTNTVIAETRSCGTYKSPISLGNAIVAVDPNGTAFATQGTPQFTVYGGGVFSNSGAGCGGNASLIVGTTQDPQSITSVGGSSFGCHGVNVTGQINQNQTSAKLSSSYILSAMPQPPDCAHAGNAVESPVGSGQWFPPAGQPLGKVALDTHANMNFNPGVYCVTNSPGNIHGNITGTNVTFYSDLSNFNVNFNGGGSFVASAPMSGPYAGLLFFLKPQTDGSGNITNTQSIQLHGNGTGILTGSILAPSADITMLGNSGSLGDDTQIVGYDVYAGGTAAVTINYNESTNYTFQAPMNISIIK